MITLAKSYIDVLDKLDIRAEGIYETVKKIHVHRTTEHKDKVNMFYHMFETPEKYFEFVIKIKKRYCDELVEFVILRGIFDVYSWCFTSSIKLLFFNKLAEIYLKVDSEKELSADIRDRKNFCKNLESDKPDVVKLEKLFQKMYRETLRLIHCNLLM